MTAQDREHLCRVLHEQGGFSVPDAPLSAQAFLVRNLFEATKMTWVCITDGDHTMDAFSEDLQSLLPDDAPPPLMFPPLPITGHSRTATDPLVTGQRLHTLLHLKNHPAPGILMTCIQALMQPTLSPQALQEALLSLHQMSEYAPEKLSVWLQQHGYEFTHEVQQRCEASLRGGIVDIWPPNAEWPVRLEFFGDILESIRTFDPAEQRSIEKRGDITLVSAKEVPAGAGNGHQPYAYLYEHIPRRAGWAWLDENRIREHADMYEHTVRTTREADPDSMDIATCHDVCETIRKTFTAGQVFLGGNAASELPFTFLHGEHLPRIEGSAMQPDLMEKARVTFIENLEKQAAAGSCVHLYFDTPGSRSRFQEMFPKACAGKQFHLHTGPLSEGFTYPNGKLLVVAEQDIYGYRKERHGTIRRRQSAKTRFAGMPYDFWADIQPGEHVVHADHGVGKYLGLYEMEFHQQLQEVMAVEYADQARLYVPVTQAHLLSRYIGVGHRRPELHRLGGRRWTNQKAAAEKAVEDLAASLLETQASRETLSGHAFAPDTQWQHEFEASFPYPETEDQLHAIHAVKEDLESIRPMDRLICGDVGYGKTEVAMRAAFKVVMEGKQVAMLVPTTVLAQQHFYTFTSRMAAFPVHIEMLSRFRTRAQQESIVRNLRDGGVDIVIGTHRLVQQDVHFKDLGLVIIDEEQRFGVTHKERLKQLRQLVDVLTMTATPIPRTLYMSLTGARDMSTIQTPPRERLPIETHVVEYTDDLVRDVILRELNREGQVFFLHNRVMTIHQVEQRLKKLVPEARIGVGHGQMSERALAKVMRLFVQGDIDVLLCTTIIESGVDIPNVNTILIDRADRFGMADLYQLRGRVGRYRHKAYAYLLLPRHGQLFHTARQRIGAIKRYSSLGAGFKLALRDLEIRGAGNLLGAQQSGHIAAIGFDLYCQLLRRTIAHIKGETTAPLVQVEMRLDFIDRSPRHAESCDTAAIPYGYIEDENHRVQIYRDMAAAGSIRTIDRLRDSLRDRFGPVPAPMLRLLAIARIRICAAEKGISAIETREDKLILTRAGDYIKFHRRFPRLQSSDPDGKLQEILAFLTGLQQTR